MSHQCHWPGCAREVPPKLWGCSAHWFTLPQEIRASIWREYREGQEIMKTPSRAYLEVADEAHKWALNHIAAKKRERAALAAAAPQVTGDLFA
jgi:hypothetical protein